MRREIIILALMAILGILTSLKAQPKVDNNCLEMIYPNDYHKEWNEEWKKWDWEGSINLDSIKIDTCKDSPTFGKRFAKKYFIIQFMKNQYPFDKGLDTGETRGYNYISNTKPELKEKFKKLEEKFGKFYFKGLDKKLTEKMILFNPKCRIYFDDYKCIDDIVQYIKMNFSSVKNIKFQNRSIILLTVPNDKALRQNLSGSSIHSALDFFPRHWKHSGFQSEIYEMKSPLAWEITMGKPQIKIAFSDVFIFPTIHPDVYPNHETPSSGDGIEEYDQLGDNHGLYTTSNAVALANNNYPMVGSAPKCHALSIYYEINNVSDADADGLINERKLFPDVRNCSYGSNNLRRVSRLLPNDIDSGIVVVASAGNDRTCLNGAYHAASQILPDGSIRFIPTTVFPAATVFADPLYPTDATKDYRPIAVGATKSGILKNMNCDLWENGVNDSANYSNQIQFRDIYNFSPDVNKFDINSDIVKYRDSITLDTLYFYSRQLAKEKAFVDVVAPGDGIVCADGADDYTMKSGTSMSGPFVAGICGLMLSVNKFMGVPLTLPVDSLYTKPICGTDVQRKAYDIITFTAKKIPDFENFTRGALIQHGTEHYLSYQFYDGRPYQYEYVTQWNDKLKRSWAQRVGFGLVDAYRAVAHSIRQKGQYVYTIGTTNYNLPMYFDNGVLPTPDPRGYFNPDSIRIMHWGSQVNEGNLEFELANWRGQTSGNDGIYNVLDWGGASLPNETHNNQGVTRINSDDPAFRRHITVQDSSILAIDGILISDQPTACHYVTTSSTDTSESVILMEGLIKNVEITGNLKIGDLIIESSIDNGIGGVPGCVGFSSQLENNYGEIYGEVFVNNKALLYAWSNLKTQPGSFIHLNGEKDMYLYGTSIMTMRNNSGIDGLEDRKIVVTAQAELFIEDSAIVDIDCEINVLAGGKLTLGTKAVAKIKKLNIEAGATVTVPSGAVMALKDPEHIVNGNFYVGNAPSLHGTAKVIGKLDDNCLPLGSEKYANTKYISTQPVIYMKGNPLGIPYTTTLTINNSEFKNISINATDVRIPFPIFKSGFYTESRHANPYFNFDFLISINYDRCQNYNPQINRLVMFDSCQFIDSSTIERFPSEPDNWNKFIYRTGGVLLNDCEYVRFNVCDFKRLEYGITANNSIQMDIYTSKFDTCGIGDYAFATGTLLCENKYNIVQYGSFRDNAFDGKAFNNNYTRSRFSYYAINSGEQRFRGNTFDQYYRAVSSENTKIIMQTIIEDNMQKIYGMNDFKFDQIISLANYNNKFITKDCEIDTTNHKENAAADVFTNGKIFDLNVECGHNRFSEFAPYHILNLVPGNPFLNIKINAFRPPMVPPRISGIIPFYNGNLVLLNESQWIQDTLHPQYPGLCCGDKTDSVMNDICTENVYANYECIDGSESGEGGQLFLTELSSYTIDENLINSATQNKIIALSSYLSESGNKKDLLLKLKNELKQTNLVPQKDKELARLCIDLKLLDSININDYETDYVDNLIFKHNIYRKNNKNDLQSMGYMSMLSFLSNRYDKGCNDGINYINESTESNLNIVSIVPNPTTDIATLTFTVSDANAVDIIISDIQGNTVLKETTFPTSNNNTYKINSKNMSPGVYLVTLSSNGHRVTDKLIVVK